MNRMERLPLAGEASILISWPTIRPSPLNTSQKALSMRRSGLAFCCEMRFTLHGTAT